MTAFAIKQILQAIATKQTVMTDMGKDPQVCCINAT